MTTLTPGPRFHRYVALGDSFTEGVGDHECRDARLRHVNGLTARRPALEPVDTLLDPH